MAQQPQQPGSTDDDMLRTALVGLILVFVIFAFVAAQQERINIFVGAVSWVHVAPFAYLARWLPFLQDIPFLGSWLFVPAENVERYLSQGGWVYMDMTAETQGYRSMVLTASGRVALLVYCPIMVWVGINGRNFRVDTTYRTQHTLDSMIWAQSETWMTSRMTRHINPLKDPELSSESLTKVVRERIKQIKPLPGRLLPEKVVSLAPSTWNRSLRPEEWLISSGLSYDRAIDARISAPGFITVPADFEFRERWEGIEMESIAEVLAEQLRTPWKGPANMRPCHKALFAVMAMFYGYDTEGGNRLLSDLGVLADATKVRINSMDSAIVAEQGMMARIDGIIAGKMGTRLAQKGNQHAWLESAFPTFIHLARKDRGVLPPAAFLWLKAEDRLMWYILNNVGNEAVMVEAAGALAHSRAENQIGKPIMRPAVYQAARAMREDYMDLMPERIEIRRGKAVRQRNPGTEMDLIRRDILSDKTPVADPDGLDEDMGTSSAIPAKVSLVKQD